VEKTTPRAGGPLEAGGAHRRDAAQVHEVIRADDDDLDIDPALAACVQLSLAGPHLAPGSQPAAPPPMTLSAFGHRRRPRPQTARANLFNGYAQDGGDAVLSQGESSRHLDPEERW